jgi:hypothetical protein
MNTESAPEWAEGEAVQYSQAYWRGISGIERLIQRRRALVWRPSSAEV